MTEEAKKELEESGEDVSDFTVNVSKLQDKIKSLTKVSANDFKGFDILTDSGAYKSTYEIMLGIGKIWEDIGKEQGDLAQANLLESMFGKNRAQIGAAILQSPDILESAYNDSLNNSLGSADKELNTYLESIDAHLNKVKESWNQIWQSGAGREVINPILDVADAVLNVVNNIGLLNTGLGLTGGTLGLFKNVGRAKYPVVPLNIPTAHPVVTPNEFMQKMVA